MGFQKSLSKFEEGMKHKLKISDKPERTGADVVARDHTPRPYLRNWNLESWWRASPEEISMLVQEKTIRDQVILSLFHAGQR